jgi:hypothetical protein
MFILVLAASLYTRVDGSSCDQEAPRAHLQRIRLGDERYEFVRAEPPEQLLEDMAKAMCASNSLYYINPCTDSIVVIHYGSLETSFACSLTPVSQNASTHSCGVHCRCVKHACATIASRKRRAVPLA